MPYSWSKNSPIDSVGVQRSVFSSAFRNVRYALAFSKSYVLTQSDVANLPGLAYKEYGTVSAFHVLLAYNGMSDPLTDIYPGVRMRFFTKASLDAYLSEQRSPLSSRRTIRI